MPTVITGAVAIALFGWFATIVALSRSKLSSEHKRMLVVPLWLPWFVLALGPPMLHGLISWQEALNLGGAITIGMLVSVVMSRNRPQG